MEMSTIAEIETAMKAIDDKKEVIERQREAALVKVKAGYDILGLDFNL